MNKDINDRYYYVRNQRIAYSHEIELLDKEKLEISELKKEFVPAVLYDAILRLYETNKIYYGLEIQLEDIMDMIEIYHFDVYMGNNSKVFDETNEDDNINNSADFLLQSYNLLEQGQNELSEYINIYEKRISELLYIINSDTKQSKEFFGTSKRMDMASKKIISGKFISEINLIMTEVEEEKDSDVVQNIIDMMFEYDDRV